MLLKEAKSKEQRASSCSRHPQLPPTFSVATSSPASSSKLSPFLHPDQHKQCCGNYDTQKISFAVAPHTSIEYHVGSHESQLIISHKMMTSQDYTLRHTPAAARAQASAGSPRSYNHQHGNPQQPRNLRNYYFIRGGKYNQSSFRPRSCCEFRFPKPPCEKLRKTSPSIASFRWVYTLVCVLLCCVVSMMIVLCAFCWWGGGSVIYLFCRIVIVLSKTIRYYTDKDNDAVKR